MELSEGRVRVRPNISAPTKIKVTQGHDLCKIKSIVNSKKPMVLVLESQLPNLNEQVIEYANYFASDGWEIINKKTIRKYRNKKGTGSNHVQ